jgi:putative redox protein
MIRTHVLTTPYQTNFSNGTHNAVADVPIEKGGSGQGFGPHELLEAALATCLSMTVQMYAAKHGLPLHGVGCEVRIDRAIFGHAVFSYALSFDGPLSVLQCADLREAASRCPVARTLGGSLSIQSKAAEDVA